MLKLRVKSLFRVGYSKHEEYKTNSLFVLCSKEGILEVQYFYNGDKTRFSNLQNGKHKLKNLRVIQP